MSRIPKSYAARRPFAIRVLSKALAEQGVVSMNTLPGEQCEDMWALFKASRNAGIMNYLIFRYGNFFTRRGPSSSMLRSRAHQSQVKAIRDDMIFWLAQTLPNSRALEYGARSIEII